MKFIASWTDGHAKRIMTRFENDIFPWIGKIIINEITAVDLLQALQRIEGRGAIETAHRTLQSCSQVFRYGVATSRCKRDITPNLPAF